MKVLLCFFLIYSLSLQAVDHEGIDWKTIRNPSREVPHHRKIPPHIKETELDSNPRNRPIPFKILHYSLDITADPDHQIIRGTSSLSIQSRVQSLEVIRIDARDMEVSSVKVGSVNTSFRYDGDVIEILLSKALSFNERADLHIVYTAKRSQNFYTVGPNRINPERMKTAYTFTQPEDSHKWFPCVDRPSMKAPFEIKVSVPLPYKVLSNGILLSKIETESLTQFHYKMEHPIAPYLVSLAIGNYEVLSLGEYRGKALTLWTPPALKNAALHDTARTSKMMEVFGRFTGVEYPFASYAQSIAPAWEVSMEHQAASTLGSWVISGDGTDEVTVAHELAHQWFGDWVTPEVWSDLWLSEGFANYMSYIFYLETDADHKALGEIDDWRESYFAEAKKTPHALSPLNPNLDTMFDSHAYEKGALVIRLIRFLINQTPTDGEEPFKKAVKHYLSEHASGTVRHSDFQRSLEYASGNSWQVFFDQWVRSPGHPQLKVGFENQNNELVLTINQTQTQKDWPTFQFSIPADLYGEDGQQLRRVVEIYDSEQEVRIPMTFKVVAVDFDPNWEIPAEVDVQQDLKAWFKVLNSSSSELSQIHAVRQILIKTPIAQEELLQSLILVPSLYVKADAMDKLSKKTENRPHIERIVQHMHTRKAEWDRIIHNAVAAAEAWLLKTDTGTRSSTEEQKLQDKYRNGKLSVHERKSILDKLSHISLARTQTFAIERLQEGRWVTRDRGYLLDVLSKNPTESSHGFLKEILKDASYLWFKKVITNLVAVKYDKKDLVPILLERAQKDPLLAGRCRSIELLAEQKSSKEEVCPVLQVLAKAEEDKPDRLQEVRSTAEKAMTTQGCLENKVPK